MAQCRRTGEDIKSRMAAIDSDTATNEPNENFDCSPGEESHMQSPKTAEERVLEALFQKLTDDPTFPRNTLRHLEQARADGRLADVKRVLEACHLAGGTDATDISS